VKKDEGTTLLLEAGDSLFVNETASSEAGFAKAQLLLDLDQDMGYSALCVGKEDLAATVPFLLEEAGKRKLTLLSANLLYKGKAVFEPYAVFKLKKTRVGVIGLTSPLTGPQVAGAEVEVLDPRTRLNAVLPELRAKADVIVVLSNLGEREDRTIAKSIEGIDFILGSGAGGVRHEAVKLGNSYIFRTYSKGKALGKTEVELDEKGKVLSVKNSVVLLDNRMALDEESVKKIEELKKKYPDIAKPDRRSSKGMKPQVRPDENPLLKALQDAQKRNAQGKAGNEPIFGPVPHDANGTTQTGPPPPNPLLEFLKKHRQQEQSQGQEGASSPPAGQAQEAKEPVEPQGK
jgi:5'-nucleotidase/UDP-sugar diphosphatase